jgi:hypothetical protein
VDAIVPEILASLQHTSNLVIEAPPGAGKTTRVPPAILGLVSGEVIVLEPRRIAARLAARRVAWELGEEVGGTVGYQVRFEESIGPRTRLRFVTEGILTRRFLIDPTPKGVDAVSGDYLLNSAVGGGAALKGAGLPGMFPGGTSTGALDIGAVQSASGGGGGGTSGGYSFTFIS